MKKLAIIFSWVVLLLTASNIFSQNYNLELRSTLEFPNQTLANVCGYAQNGREYALLGAQFGMVIVDVTNPDMPVQLLQIPGPDNLWKEIKVYGHYAYITSEGGGGVQIVDMSGLPGVNLPYHNYYGDGSINNNLNTIHALHIDQSRGFLYAYGSNLFGGGAVVLNLNADPYNPVFVGKFDGLGYIHDGYVDNDTLYAGHIGAGLMSIVDMSNKLSPVVLGSVETPGKFTHNTWLLDDHKHALTTDEKLPSFLTCYDVSDPSDIKETSRISTNDGYNSYGHNTHVLNDWAITAWYTDGFSIVDAHKPDNLVQVGLYDTWAPSGPEYNGCWGVYPYLPSGNIIATNIPVAFAAGTGKMFVLTPTYVRAAYLEGSVTNGCTGLPLIGASIHIEGGTAGADAKTQNNGTFKTGNAAAGNFIVTVSKSGYETQTFNLTLNAAEVTTLNLTLNVENSINANGVVIDAQTQMPIGNESLLFTNGNQTYFSQTNGNGGFLINCIPAGTYKIGGIWGYLNTSIDLEDGAATVQLEPGYEDAFGVDLGWTTNATASSGDWIRAEPVGTFQNNGAEVNPETDRLSDDNEECYITGNGGGDIGNDDVDNGAVTLTTPDMKLANYQGATLSFWYWFVNIAGSSTPNDNLEVTVTNGAQTVSVFTENQSQNEWRYSGDIHLEEFLSFTDNVKLNFVATDLAPGHVLEAGVDEFKVILGGLISGVKETNQSTYLDVQPNPSATAFAVRYDWPAGRNLSLEVRNLLGQLVLRQELNTETGTVQCGVNWPSGAYVAVLRSDAGRSTPVRLLKQ